MEQKILTHKFTNAGLGNAPFRFTGITENVFKCGDGNVRAGGSCDYCGTCIRYEFHIESFDGIKSKVGCDCIEKLGDHKLTTVSELAKKKFEKEKKRLADQEKREQELKWQRRLNGGLTNYELSQKLEQEKREQEKVAGLEKGLKFKSEVEGLRDNQGGFRDSVANDLELGRIPRGRGLDIVLDILSKQKGRRDSKAYIAEYERLDKLFQ